MASSMTGSGGYAPPGKKWEGDIRPSGYRTAQMSNYTPEQSALFKQGMENVGPNSYLSRLAGGDESLFNEIEAPAFNQFNEQMGGLASRFSGMGMGGRRSSGFQNMGGQAASNFAEQLQGNRMNIRNQAIQSLHGMSQDLLNQRPFERQLYKKEEKQGMSGSGWGTLGGAALGAGVGLMGGPFGAMQAAQWGAAVGSAFN